MPFCGGWTEIIHDPNTNLSYLSNFGNTANISSTFYKNTTYGIGWGTNDYLPKKFTINISFSKISVLYSGFYNSPTGGLGFLEIDNLSSSLVSFQDGWSDDNSGQSLLVGAVSIFSASTTNIINRNDIISCSGSQQLSISMYGYTSAYPYTKRYIYNLKVR